MQTLSQYLTLVVDTTAADNKGRIPIQAATEFGAEECVLLLLKSPKMYLIFLSLDVFTAFTTVLINAQDTGTCGTSASEGR